MSSCKYTTNVLKKLLSFAWGFALGQMYYCYLLKEIPFPGSLGRILSLIISAILGLGNAVSKQVTCISVLIFPMYCGKPGRGVLKAVILTYIVTGPITNMGLNAKEVVRVFACSTQLTYNLTKEKYDHILEPLKNAAFGARNGVEHVKDAFRMIEDIIEPLQNEIEGTNEIDRIRFENDLIDDLFGHVLHRSQDMDMKFQRASKTNTSSVDYQDFYQKKLQYRCEHHLSRASAVCMQQFAKTFNICCELIPHYAERVFCRPLRRRDMCDLVTDLKQNHDIHICDPPIEPGLGQGYESLKVVNKEFVDELSDVHLQYRITYEKKLLDIQDAKETAERVQHAFQEKIIVMNHVLTAMNVCMALLFLRLFNAALKYHELYLTAIDYDNVYITDYFKNLDDRRKMSSRYSLLPLKKMERNKYTDVYSTYYKESQRSNLIMQVLKVMLEVVTATTFVMLDRLFFEALEVVRQHAEMGVMQQGTRDLDIEVEGSGILATVMRTFLLSLSTSKRNHQVSNSACLPHPRQMPHVYFLKIYGGYLWIVLLLVVNPYTLRLKRLICSYFYPRREKQRILHFYNDILKKRMKMHKTLRRKAVQSVRAHYLSGDILSLLTMRTKFPQLFGWLRMLPAARMACLICGETEPRKETQSAPRKSWYSCLTAKCPFVYCAECWREVGARCLACEPSLAELSDVDSLTDDEPLKY